jgi:hypothetical protein
MEHEMKTWPKTAEEIAHELQGTCMSLGSVLERHEMEGAEDDLDFCHALDALVFECEKCGWWFEQSEMAQNQDDWICEDCHDEADQ